MISRIEVLIRRLRRWLSRSEWAIRLLGLPASVETAAESGLVIIQVDGLSQTQLKRAIEQGEMPFLHGLTKREHYRLHSHYCGLPSSTPAVQGELFYGVKTAVPAFSYLDRNTGKTIRMFDPAAATEVERWLEKAGKPLLKGGSSYVNIYRGGADENEAHFCPAALGWGALLRAANPFALVFLFVTNGYSFVRTLVLLGLEFCLAIVDCIRGAIKGRDLIKELKFVPTRVAICILLRELATIGAKIDCARGLPVIHLNFLGYDEQAHRRGPSSKFAHWSLKGIDDSIARIWRAAKRSARRDYEIWIYSDHGQMESQPYVKKQGHTIQEAVCSVFDKVGVPSHPPRERDGRGVQSQRVRFLGGKKIQKAFPVLKGFEESPPAILPLVTAMGPVAMVYSPVQLSVSQRDRVAQELVNSAHVPLVLVNEGRGQVKAWTCDGTFLLPEQKDKILGADHPFLAELSRDIIELCQHRDAGEFVLCGWRHGAVAYSFALENGSHAGMGPDETGAFALLPADTPLPQRECDYLRPMDLREAAFKALSGTETRISVPQQRKVRGQAHKLRVMTYNVHSCVGMDGRFAPERIARVIAQYAPDIVALQELDVGRMRTGGADQAHLIANYLAMDFHFHATVHIEEEKYGDAILTHLPMRLIKADKLPGLPGKPGLEPRGALWTAIDVGGTEVQVINTHLGLWPAERRAQADALLSEAWLSHPDCTGPVLLCGDFNATPSSSVCQKLLGRLNDAQIELASHRPKKTFIGRYPVARIDHVFIDASINVGTIAVPSTVLTRTASDHLPLITDLFIPPP